uniref:Uncharacterized protein n=1 Tax=Lactuca sativa TaxID=4236 RepID=A0A9R1X6S1_LACSA|nr:hypothetical protein LSAT_V11C600316310 [Lactuca sativa]
MTYDPVGDPNDMFAHEVGKIIWWMVPFDKRTWKKVSPAIKDTVKQHLEVNYLYKNNKVDFERISQDPNIAMLLENFEVALLKGYRDRKADEKEYIYFFGSCMYFQMDEHVAASARNKKVRELQTFVNRGGRARILVFTIKR